MKKPYSQNNVEQTRGGNMIKRNQTKPGQSKSSQNKVQQGKQEIVQQPETQETQPQSNEPEIYCQHINWFLKDKTSSHHQVQQQSNLIGI